MQHRFSTSARRPARIPNSVHMSRQPLRRSALTIALQTVLASTAVGGLALAAGNVAAQTAPATATPASAREAARSFNIAAGPLEQVLSRFGREAGVTIAIDPALTAGLHSQGLQGSYTVREGLAAVLAGQRIEAVTGPAGGYRLRPREGAAMSADGGDSGAAASGGIATLAEVRVTAGSLGAVTEGTGSYTTGSSNTATRLGLTLRETPQSVSVITRQQMDDQGMTQLPDVLNQTPGLIVNQTGNFGSDSSAIYSRGFQVENFQVDGVPQLNSNYSSVFQSNDMAIYDRVEVVRGATGLMNGVGTPGATVNLVRKRPAREFQGSVFAEGGSWNYRRFGADISTPINEAGTVRGRLVAAYQENGSYVERLREKRAVLYGVVEADLTPSTLATLGFSMQNFDLTGHARSGLPLFFSDGSRTDWARSKSAAADWAYSARQNQSLFASLEHRFDSGWRVKGTYTRDRNSFDEVLGYAAGGFPNRNTGAGVNLWAGRWEGTPVQNTVDLYANGPFQLFGREHELVVGTTFSRTSFNAPNYNLWWFDDYDSSVPNIFNWDGATPAEPLNPPTGRFDFAEQTTSAYATARLRPTDSLSVLLGARVTSWKNDTSTSTFATGEVDTNNRKENNKFTPYAGIVYDFSKNMSAYASYTNIFKPQSNRSVDGSFLDPLLGKGYEVGTKGSFFGGQLNTGAAVYWVKQDNLAVSIPGVFAPDGSQAYYAASGTKTRGFELEVSGRLAEGWQASASFARNLSEDRNGARLNTNIPQSSFKLFTTYRIAGIGRGLTLGGGLRWQNGIFSANQGPQRVVFGQGGYTVVDLMARYELTKNVAATLNVYNLFDKHYYTSTSSSYFGSPRSVRLGMTVSF